MKVKLRVMSISQRLNISRMSTKELERFLKKAKRKLSSLLLLLSARNWSLRLEREMINDSQFHIVNRTLNTTHFIGVLMKENAHSIFDH